MRLKEIEVLVLKLVRGLMCNFDVITTDFDEPNNYIVDTYEDFSDAKHLKNHWLNLGEIDDERRIQIVPR